MNENSKRFVLAYSSLLLKVSALREIGLKREGTAYKDLIESEVEIPGSSIEIASFLLLLYQPNKCHINYKILLEQWNGY